MEFNDKLKKFLQEDSGISNYELSGMLLSDNDECKYYLSITSILIKGIYYYLLDKYGMISKDLFLQALNKDIQMTNILSHTSMVYDYATFKAAELKANTGKSRAFNILSMIIHKNVNEASLTSTFLEIITHIEDIEGLLKIIEE